MKTEKSYRLSGHYGAWDAAELAIEKALADAGIKSEFLDQNAARLMLALNELETKADETKTVIERFDEAGLLHVNDGEADISVNFKEQVDWAYRGFGHHEHQSHRKLRAIMSLSQPQYVCFAATKESGITSLEQVASIGRPIRLMTVSKSRLQTRFMGWVHGRVMEECGFTQDSILEQGGQVFTAADGLQAVLDDNVDLVGIPAYSSWGPSWSWSQTWMHFHIRKELNYLPIPDAVLAKLSGEMTITPGAIPVGLLRGVDHEIPTFAMHRHTVIVNEDMDEDDAYQITRAIHENAIRFQQMSVPFAYNPETALENLGAPIHPGAARFYAERGYHKP